MTDVLVDGRVIPVPPGWVIRVTLERVADDAHPFTSRGGNRAYSRLNAVKDPGDGGARPLGTEHAPTIDEFDPLPVMAPRRRNGPIVRTPDTPPRRRSGVHGKLCPGCERRCGPSTINCPECGHRFARKAAV